MHHAFLRNAVVGFDRKSGFSIIARMTPPSDHPISRVSRAGLFPCGNSSEPISKEKKSSGWLFGEWATAPSPGSMPASVWAIWGAGPRAGKRRPSVTSVPIPPAPDRPTLPPGKVAALKLPRVNSPACRFCCVAVTVPLHFYDTPQVPAASCVSWSSPAKAQRQCRV